MEVIIEMELIQTMAEHFKLLGDKSRLTILALLREFNKAFNKTGCSLEIPVPY
jgi:DNA-binding transcriptional ArsR family regulator